MGGSRADRDHESRLARGELALSALPPPADIAIALLRWLEYAGLLTTVGMFVINRLAANPPRIDWVRPPMHLSLAAALIGGIGVVAAEVVAGPGSHAGPLMYLIGQPDGWVRVARVGAEALALFFCMRGVPFVAAPAVFATAAVAFAGHASAVRLLPGGIFIDAIHVLSAGMWAGGILALATARPVGGWHGDQALALVQRFGRVAVIAFAFTALTGVLRATEELRGFVDLWGTAYGLVLSLKVIGVLAMVGLSALAWRRRVPFRRAEAVLALVALGLTAFLAAFPLSPAGA